MNLKRRFLLLNTLSVTAAVLLTALAAVLFSWFYFAFGGAGAIHSVNPGVGHILLFQNDRLVYSSTDFERIELTQIANAAQSASPTFSKSGINYHVMSERIALDDGQIGRLVRLIPQSGRSSFYITLAIFSAVVFLVLFLCANLFVIRYFKKAVIQPVVRLEQAAKALSQGEMDFVICEEGQDQVHELCLALEQLRLKLRETLYLQNKAEETRKFLLSAISHDLKTPVTSIKGYIDGVRDGVANTPEKIGQYLKTASDKTVQLNAMIDDLLLYSKLDADQIPYHFIRLKIASFLRECVAADELVFAKEGKIITLALQDAESVFVSIDPEQFRRVHQNIADNARKHLSPERGSLQVAIREAGASVILEYQDNGPGISKQDLPHIFERFYRGDSARKAGGSSGLGLAIARHIVEGHGGKIWAVSNEGQGTAILVSIKKR